MEVELEEMEEMEELSAEEEAWKAIGVAGGRRCLECDGEVRTCSRPCGHACLCVECGGRYMEGQKFPCQRCGQESTLMRIYY